MTTIIQRESFKAIGTSESMVIKCNEISVKGYEYLNQCLSTMYNNKKFRIRVEILALISFSLTK